MIIRIQASGGSFRGAGAYYLHDKAADASIDKALKPQSAERVWFTETRNCMNQDPFRALDEMWGVAADQQYLKMQAGVSRGGRVCEDAVKTIAMSWHKDDAPSPEHMIESADKFLKHMGWDGHQAVYAGHNDTDHRHVHIILNRVNPDNGRTLDDYREQKRAQEWALQYEREHGQVRCDLREANAAREKSKGQGREAANDHLPHNVITLTRPLEQQFAADELQRAGRDADAREQLKVEQRQERKQFFADGARLFKATRVAAYKEVREEFKAEWRDYYRDAKAAGISIERDAEASVRSAQYFAYAGQWERARDVFNDRHAGRDATLETLRERKADIELRQTATIDERQQDACDALREVREIQYQELLKRQAAERTSLQAGVALEAAGVRQQPDREATAMLWAQVPANQNTDRVAEPVVSQPSRIEAGRHALEATALSAIDQALPAESGAHIDASELSTREPGQSAAPTTQMTDLAAGTIGSVASYLADQLGELFAPTPPEVREAQAKAAAKQETERPAPEPKGNEYEKILAAAMRAVEAERQQQGDAWWKERDRGKGWERDQ
jgi:Relaxase/Mobilisation nuclease domain